MYDPLYDLYKGEIRSSINKYYVPYANKDILWSDMYLLKKNQIKSKQTSLWLWNVYADHTLYCKIENDHVGIPINSFSEFKT